MKYSILISIFLGLNLGGSIKANEKAAAAPVVGTTISNIGPVLNEKFTKLSKVVTDNAKILIEKGSKKAAECKKQIESVDWKSKFNQAKDIVNSNFQKAKKSIDKQLKNAKNKFVQSELNKKAPDAGMAIGGVLILWALLKKLSFNSKKIFERELAAINDQLKDVTINTSIKEKLAKDKVELQKRINSTKSFFIGLTGSALAAAGYIYKK